MRRIDRHPLQALRPQKRLVRPCCRSMTDRRRSDRVTSFRLEPAHLDRTERPSMRPKKFMLKAIRPYRAVCCRERAVFLQGGSRSSKVGLQARQVGQTQAKVLVDRSPPQRSQRAQANPAAQNSAFGRPPPGPCQPTFCKATRMRSWFSILGLVLVLAVVGVIASRQLTGLRATPAAGVSPPQTASSGAGRAANLPDQYQRALDAALQSARPLEGDAR